MGPGLVANGWRVGVVGDGVGVCGYMCELKSTQHEHNKSLHKDCGAD